MNRIKAPNSKCAPLSSCVNVRLVLTIVSLPTALCLLSVATRHAETMILINVKPDCNKSFESLSGMLDCSGDGGGGGGVEGGAVHVGFRVEAAWSVVLTCCSKGSLGRWPCP